jgi:murein DD-endopeptidase MepM/ murein hydrolase activator NlpD
MSKLPHIYIVLIAFLALSSCSTTPTENNSAAESVPAPVKSTATNDTEKNVIKKEQLNGNTRLRKRPIFDWPVWEARMSRGFLPHGTRKRRRPHKGIDLAAARGSAVMASHDGIVIYTGKAFKGYGKMIMIESADSEIGSGYATLYGHLDKIVVFEGQKIRQGEVIGALGNTGRSSGPHLHFEIRKLDGPIDPLPLLPAGKELTNEVDDPSAPEE